MNKCLFSGRLTKEPVYKAAYGEKKASMYFSFALDTSYKAKKQEELNGKKEESVYLTCWLWGEEATKMSSKLYKGVKVLVEGEFGVYSRDDGTQGMKINVKSCEIMGHTKAYLSSHGDKIKEEEAKEKSAYSKDTADRGEKSTSGWWNNRGRDFEDEEVDDYLCKPVNTRNTRNSKTGVMEDADGFMVISEDDTDLPFN